MELILGLYLIFGLVFAVVANQEERLPILGWFAFITAWPVFVMLKVANL